MTGQTTARGAGGAETVTGTFSGNFFGANAWYYDGEEHHADEYVSPGDSITIAKGSVLVTQYIQWTGMSGGITAIGQSTDSASRYLSAFTVTGDFTLIND